MKGLALVLLSFMAPVSVFSETASADFEFSANSPLTRDPMRVLRTPVNIVKDSALVTDSRSEIRGSRPSVAYTVFRLEWQNVDAAVQPVFGRINGAQIKVNW